MLAKEVKRLSTAAGTELSSHDVADRAPEKERDSHCKGLENAICSHGLEQANAIGILEPGSENVADDPGKDLENVIGILVVDWGSEVDNPGMDSENAIDSRPDEDWENVICSGCRD